MRHFMITVFTGFLGLSVLTSPCRAVQPPQGNFPELDRAKSFGWQLTILIVKKLEASNRGGFPGMQAWLQDFRKATKGINLQTAPNRWPVKIDADALMTRNPNFWRAYYEIAPADFGLMILQAGLLLAAGEVSRASHVVLIAGQAPGIPKDFQPGFDIL
jgi:hypothetical protein